MPDIVVGVKQVHRRRQSPTHEHLERTLGYQARGNITAVIAPTGRMTSGSREYIFDFSKIFTLKIPYKKINIFKKISKISKIFFTLKIHYKKYFLKNRKYFSLGTEVIRPVGAIYAVMIPYA